VSAPGVDFESAERLLAERLSAGAVEHSRRAASTAEGLARTYGVDPAKARLSGLLHDWDRELDHAELLARARSMHIPVTPVDEAVPYLLHARVGAADLETAFPGIDADVLAAVGRHTVGSVDMAALDKIAYLADMMEPGRDFPGVDELRTAVGTASLDELFSLAYTASLRHIIDGRRHMHPETVAVWNSVVASSGR
jgi:predicted HD superfamily hydrolase involved in NAD metabolism